MDITETLSQVNSTVIATVAGLVVGVVMKFATKVTERRKDNLTEHLELRKELREELDTVKEELHLLQKQLDEWREKYYHQVEVTAVLHAEITALKHELAEYKNQTGEHSVELPFLDLHEKDD
jgi:uncharacterized coiled-coil DUF342 family protein